MYFKPHRPHEDVSLPHGIQAEGNFKLLGIVIEQNLKFNLHVANAYKRISSGIHLLRCFSKYCSKEAYYGVICPCLFYGIQKWVSWTPIDM